MRKAAIVFSMFMCAPALLGFALKNKTWDCGMNINRHGRGTPHIEGRSKSYGPIHGTVDVYGAFIQSMSYGAGDRFPSTEAINFYGHNDFRFRYRGDVTAIRLGVGKATVYEGPPIASYRVKNAAGQPISMYFEWNGPEATVEVADSCSLVSLLRGLL